MKTAATATGGRVCACGRDGSGGRRGIRGAAVKAVLTGVRRGAREEEGRG